jgi:hypothetical protein
VALPDYFRRGAVAISQILAGYDETAIRDRLDSSVLGISISAEANRRDEGKAIADLMVRLAARLYPTLAMEGPAQPVEQLRKLAHEINPKIEFADVTRATVNIAIGESKTRNRRPSIFVGSDRWTALLSRSQPQIVGESRNPFGAGAAACLAMAATFRELFMEGANVERQLRFPVIPRTLQPTRLSNEAGVRTILVGVGAIGNSFLWAMSRVRPVPPLTLIDPEVLEPSNLQRYILATPSDIQVPKVDIGKRLIPTAEVHIADWESFVRDRGHKHTRVVVAVDSARDRIAVQASLPKMIFNAWTQPGDLGVSAHDFLSAGACLACLYLPTHAGLSEDAIYANALGIPDQQATVRTLLHTSGSVPIPILHLIADRLGVEHDVIEHFSTRPIRELYRDGICGGAVLPIGSTGSPRADVHVPMAHQSALAGIMLAARVFAKSSGIGPTLVSRLDLTRPFDPRFVVQATLKDQRGICICQDPDYVNAYRRKYPTKRLHSSDVG